MTQDFNLELVLLNRTIIGSQRYSEGNCFLLSSAKTLIICYLLKFSTIPLFVTTLCLVRGAFAINILTEAKVTLFWCAQKVGTENID